MEGKKTGNAVESKPLTFPKESEVSKFPPVFFFSSVARVKSVHASMIQQYSSNSLMQMHSLNIAHNLHTSSNRQHCRQRPLCFVFICLRDWPRICFYVKVTSLAPTGISPHPEPEHGFLLDIKKPEYTTSYSTRGDNAL